MRVRKLGIFLIAAAMLAMVGCGVKLEKTAVTPDDFATAVEDLGFEVFDDTADYNTDVGITTSIYGVDDDHTESYEFYVFESVDAANAQMDSMQQQIENMDASDKSQSTMSGNNYSVLKVTADGVYYHVCAVDNTLFYGSSVVAKKSNIEEFAKKLGYN